MELLFVSIIAPLVTGGILASFTHWLETRKK